RPETEAHVLMAGARQHQEERSKSRREDLLAQIDRIDDRQRGGREVVDDQIALVGLRVVGLHETRQGWQLVGRRRLDENSSPAVVKHHRQEIVTDYLVGDLGHLGKYGADVEHGSY